MTYLLVPGAGGQAWDWHRLVPLLDDAVAVELPAADDSAGLQTYADVIVAAAGPDPGPVTVVAHSMGGLSVPLVCGRLEVRRLVLLNAMIPAPGESGSKWWEGSGHSQVDIGEFDEVEHFYHDLPTDVRAEALARPEARQSETAFAEPWPLAGWPDVPTEVLAGADDRLFPVHFQRRLARERLGLDVRVVPGGHMAALSRPEELAAALQA
ncbi:alpha/beta fold hydrolase [Serinicoccus kebangsaanensis]|uniref:alpha/beta fold hydrolase n=1 Tax=Serinicoccus kebangsaanensis TaxID=2602069 RepID=UPI00124E237B|nr:alpha/beta hydrolase [Serinicoccus kebangsaanensis]